MTAAERIAAMRLRVEVDNKLGTVDQDRVDLLCAVENVLDLLDETPDSSAWENGHGEYFAATRIRNSIKEALQ